MRAERIRGDRQPNRPGVDSCQPMSAIPNPVRLSVEEYLATSYRLDCDYVDGEVLERNWGEKDHAILQGALTFLFHTHRDEWKVDVFPELRVQVKATRFRIPDVTVVPSD
jgi:hypothetical protein